MTVHFRYEPEFGDVVPDNRALDYVLDAVRKGGEYVVGSELLINILRLRVAEGWVQPSDVMFSFGHHEIAINEYGRLAHYPDGFCCVGDDTVASILVAAHNRRRTAERKEKQ